MTIMAIWIITIIKITRATRLLGLRILFRIRFLGMGLLGLGLSRLLGLLGLLRLLGLPDFWMIIIMITIPRNGSTGTMTIMATEAIRIRKTTMATSLLGIRGLLGLRFLGIGLPGLGLSWLFGLLGLIRLL